MGRQTLSDPKLDIFLGIPQAPTGSGTTELGYGTTNADAGVGIENLTKKPLISR